MRTRVQTSFGRNLHVQSRFIHHWTATRGHLARVGIDGRQPIPSRSATHIRLSRSDAQYAADKNLQRTNATNHLA